MTKMTALGSIRKLNLNDQLEQPERSSQNHCLEETCTLLTLLTARSTNAFISESPSAALRN